MLRHITLTCNLIMKHNGYNIYIMHIVSTADTEMKTGGREKKGGEGGC